jgi:alpha-tubulin suppressor-like RCC1 family protein
MHIFLKPLGLVFLLTLTAFAVAGALTPVRAGDSTDSPISVGGLHTCYAETLGSAKCWGYNAYGQLGDGTNTDRAIPVKVKRIKKVLDVSAVGFGHTCAAKIGKAYCWGRNTFGQLGNGKKKNSEYPVKVKNLKLHEPHVAAGYSSHTCAFKAEGKKTPVFCWGRNHYGQLGDGTTKDRKKPVKVKGLTRITDVVLGYNHTCALTKKGRVYCWGANHFGQLGNGSKKNRIKPVKVRRVKNVTSISAGYYHTCARISKGNKIMCWGYNSNGQLGDGTTETRLKPVDVSDLGSAVHVAAGGHHTCSVLIDGAVRCWGYNLFGQLGIGTKIDRYLPVNVVTLNAGVTAVSAGQYHTCAVQNGKAKCWGENNAGQLGDGSEDMRLTPVNVIGLD